MEIIDTLNLTTKLKESVDEGQEDSSYDGIFATTNTAGAKDRFQDSQGNGFSSIDHIAATSEGKTANPKIPVLMMELVDLNTDSAIRKTHQS
jgi:hypothetical protein